MSGVLGVVLTSTGWSPGGPLHGTPDPSSAPNPVDLVGSVKDSIGTILTGSAGAMILVAAGVLALSKAWAVALKTIRARREPQQLTLF